MLVYILPCFLVRHLVTYSIVRLNVWRTKAIGDNVFARVSLTIQKIDYK